MRRWTPDARTCYGGPVSKHTDGAGRIRLDHVAIAVSEIHAAVREFEAALGVPCEKIEDVPAQEATVAFFEAGGAHLELVAPFSPESPVGRSIAKRGEGIHHICLEVDDIEAALADLRARGVRLVDETPRPGAGGSKVAFVHPKALRGVLMELVQKPAPAEDADAPVE